MKRKIYNNYLYKKYKLYINKNKYIKTGPASPRREVTRPRARPRVARPGSRTSKSVLRGGPRINNTGSM